MTDNAGDARAGIAQAVDDMSASTRALIHEEIQAAQREAWQRAKELAPGGAMLAGAGVLGVFAAAAAFRLSLRALEKMTGPGRGRGDRLGRLRRRRRLCRRGRAAMASRVTVACAR